MAAHGKIGTQLSLQWQQMPAVHFWQHQLAYARERAAVHKAPITRNSGKIIATSPAEMLLPPASMSPSRKITVSVGLISIEFDQALLSKKQRSNN